MPTAPARWRRGPTSTGARSTTGFYVAGRQVKRKLGVKRRAGESTGLTKTGAERALQKLIDAEVRVVPMGERIDVLAAGERYLVHLDQVMHRRPTTLQDYTIMLH